VRSSQRGIHPFLRGPPGQRTSGERRVRPQPHRAQVGAGAALPHPPSRAPARGRESELTGHDVILVHRMLKNSAAEVLGLRGYALCSEACTNALGIDAVALGMKRHSEDYPDVGDVPGWVVDLERRWEAERERSRVFVAPGEEALSVAIGSPAGYAQSVTSTARRASAHLRRRQRLQLPHPRTLGRGGKARPLRPRRNCPSLRYPHRRRGDCRDHNLMASPKTFPD
jgi:hypothetical protein